MQMHRLETTPPRALDYNENEGTKGNAHAFGGIFSTVQRQQRMHRLQQLLGLQPQHACTQVAKVNRSRLVNN